MSLFTRVLSKLSGRDLTRKRTRTTKRSRKARKPTKAEEERAQREFVRPLEGGKVNMPKTAKEIKKLVKAAKAKVRK